MIKNKHIFLFVLFLLFVPFIVYGDVVIPLFMRSRRLFVIGILVAFIINLIVNGFILSISYFILRQKRLIKSWKFLKYIFFVTIGGALIDLVYVAGDSADTIVTYMVDYLVYTPEIIRLFSVIKLLSVLFTFLGLLFYNYWLSRRIFNLTKKQGIFIGITMSILTNPIFGGAFWLLVLYF